ncbi:MAG: cytochrome D1 domain-containing protein [Rhodoferax sp.]|uniref:cytochrome D1 domain-containing protein n=2 Tax=Candidatus Aalborgicola defluviihabitans TaxID=3386187 RepID=UPI00390902DD|nr:hypothetical protein [Burkholderiales bacterium]
MSAMGLAIASTPTIWANRRVGPSTPPHSCLLRLSGWRFLILILTLLFLFFFRLPYARAASNNECVQVVDQNESINTLPAAVSRQLTAPATYMALSADGCWLAVATDTPPTLWLFDGGLQLKVRHLSTTLDGKHASQINSIKDNRLRKSFIVGQKDIPELWEISYDANAEPIHDGYVHDYRMGESIAKPGFLGIRRTLLEEPLEVIQIESSGVNVLTAPYSVEGKQAPGHPLIQVINLNIRRKVAEIPQDSIRAQLPQNVRRTKN